MQIYGDYSAEFWPSGWMVYMCIALGLFDAGLIATIVLQVVHHGI